jgi:hypothetical protein
MALIQKLSLRRKTAETPKTSDAPVAEETPVETPEVSETPQPAAQPAKRLITKKAPAPEPDEDIIEAEVEPAPAPSKKLATRQPVIEADEDPDEAASETAVVSYRPMAMGQIDGAISERDLMRPRVNMVQSNSSDLESKGFTVGQIVVNGEVLVWDKGYDPLNVILMTGRKKFIQRLTDDEYKDGVIPMIFDSPRDAENAGFSTNWDGKQPPAADPGLFCLFLLEQPEYIEPDPIFSLEHAERKFCLAEMKFTGVNYRASTAARWLMTQSQTSLIPDTRMFMLGLTCSREKQKSGNIVTVANFRNLGRHKDPGFAEWVLSLG